MNDALIQKIRKILSKTAEAGCTEEEANSAFALANKLMMEHNITMMQVKTSGEQSEQVFGEAKADEYGKWTLDISLAAGTVQDFFFVKYIAMPKPGARRYNILLFFGTKENAITAKYVYDGLISAFDNLWTSYQRKHRRPAKERRTFIRGVTEGFKCKLREERKNLVQEQDLTRGAGGTEIVLRSVVQQTLERFNKTYPDLKYRKVQMARDSYNPQTRAAGFNAGKNLNISRPIGHSKSTSEARKGLVK